MSKLFGDIFNTSPVTVDSLSELLTVNGAATITQIHLRGYHVNAANILAALRRDYLVY